MKTFDEYHNLNEGGNALDAFTQKIANKFVPATLSTIQKKIFPLLGLEGLEIDAYVLGSAGKKPAEEFSGDIDIAVSVDKIAGHGSVSIKDALSYMKNVLDKAGFQTNAQYGFNQVNVAVEIGGDKKNGYVQVDLMLSDNLDWSRFQFHSPDFRKAESRYKGAHRSILINAIASEGMKVTLKTDEVSGEVEEYEQMVNRMTEGLFKVRKTMRGKRGLVKTPKILKDYEQKVTNVPEDAVKILFGENVKVSEVDTFEKAWSVMHSGNFPFPDKRDIIVNKFMYYMKGLSLPIPDEIKDKYQHIYSKHINESETLVMKKERKQYVKLYEDFDPIIDSGAVSESINRRTGSKIIVLLRKSGLENGRDYEYRGGEFVAKDMEIAQEITDIVAGHYKSAIHDDRTTEDGKVPVMIVESLNESKWQYTLLKKDDKIVTMTADNINLSNEMVMKQYPGSDPMLTHKDGKEIKWDRGPMGRISQTNESVVLNEAETKQGKELVNIMVGRFQPFHIGHYLACSELHSKNGYPVVLVSVRASGKSGKGTVFTEATMSKMMKDTIKETKFIKDHVEIKFVAFDTQLFPALRPKYEPVLMGAGDDRFDTYERQRDSMEIKHENKLNMRDDFAIFQTGRHGSGTAVRDAISNNDKKAFDVAMPKFLHGYFDEMSKEMGVKESINEAVSLPAYAEDVTEVEFKKALIAMAKALKKPLKWVDAMIYKHYIEGGQLNDKGVKQKAAKQGVWVRESKQILEYLMEIYHTQLNEDTAEVKETKIIDGPKESPIDRVSRTVDDCKVDLTKTGDAIEKIKMAIENGADEEANNEAVKTMAKAVKHQQTLLTEMTELINAANN